MKKVIFIMSLAFGLMSFTISNNTKEVSLNNDTNTIETISNDLNPCRWRFCSVKKGVKVCTDWEYGYCLPGFELKV